MVADTAQMIISDELRGGTYRVPPEHERHAATFDEGVLCAGMDWKLFASTFVAIFVAEIGDKTQLATLSLAAGGSSRWVVFAGSAAALVAASAIAVVAGEALARTIPPIWLKRGAGLLFIVLGALFLLQSQDDDEPTAAPQSEPDS